MEIAPETALLSNAFAIAEEAASDLFEREALLDRAMGPKRRKKSSEKLRRGRLPAEGLAFVAKDGQGRLAGTVRLWDVAVKSPSPLWGGARGGGPAGVEATQVGRSPWPRNQSSDGDVIPPPLAPPHKGEGNWGLLLLGPLAVEPSTKGAGIGSSLMRHAIAEARRLGHRAILLVGDAPYYARFGFSAAKTGNLAMPGPYERERFLALELEDGALDGATGVLKATGRKIPVVHTSLAA